MSQIFIPTSDGGSLPPDVPLTFTTDDAAVVSPQMNNLNVSGGTGATTRGNNLTATIFVDVVSTVFPWEDRSADFNAAVQTGYFCRNTLTATLPPTAGLTRGNTIIIFVDTSGSQIITIQADGTQEIQIGEQFSSMGGAVSSNVSGSVLELVFNPTDEIWHTVSSLGTWAIV